jgi:DNA-binding response OmpR family regulator
MSSSAPQKIDESMRLLRQRYVQRLHEQLHVLNRLLALCEKQLLAEEDRQALRMQAHKIAGTGKTYGFQMISEKAKNVEEALLTNPETTTDQLVPLLHQLISVCKNADEKEFYIAQSPETVSEAASPKKQQDLPLILTIDDDEDVTSLIAELFKGGAQIISADNAIEGARLMKSRRPDIVLLDDMMPGGVSGLHMLEEMRSDPALSKIPVIMLTTSNAPQDVMRGFIGGAVDYITKPFNPTQLSWKVANYLARQSATILLVDDDENVTDLLAYKLQSLGYKVVLCENGIRALLIMEKIVPALVILDRMMPGMDGMSLLQKMRQLPPLKNVPVLFLTAKRQEADIIEGLRLGASDYIVKPFNPDEVVVRVERFIKLAENRV